MLAERKAELEKHEMTEILSNICRSLCASARHEGFGKILLDEHARRSSWIVRP